MLTLAEVQVPRGRRTLRLAGLKGETVTSESQEHAEIGKQLTCSLCMVGTR